jgi:3-oxoadipate enol-lactonase
MKVSERRARARDGTPIGYSLHGDPAAPRSAVLVHSLAMDRHFWDAVAARLASDAAVLAYDCRGHGVSGAAEKIYSVEQFADDLADLLDHVGRRSPVLVASSTPPPGTGARRRASGKNAAFLRNDPRAYAASCRMLGAADLRPALAGIRVPAAVVVGEQDYATPVGMAKALHSNIKDSTLTVLENARHLTPLEKPDEIAAELEKLLK